MPNVAGIQFMRGIAALGVVVYHACFLSVDYAAGSVYYVGMSVGMAGVDLFFVISGFVMVISTYREFDNPSEPSRFAAYRLSRILPPYWILTTVVLAYYLYNPGGVNAEHGGVDVVASYLLLPSNLLPLVPVAWTLVYEMMFYGIFFLLILFVARKYLGPALLAWALAIVANGILLSYTTFGLDTLPLHPFNLEFIGGALVGLLFMTKGIQSVRWSVAALTAGVCGYVGLALLFQFVHAADLSSYYVRIGLFGIPALCLVYGCVAPAFADRGPVGWILLVGEFSYSLYLVHIIVIHVGYRVFTKVLGADLGLAANAALAAVLIASSVAAGWIFYRLVERPSCVAAKRLLLNLRARKHLAFQQT
ncbi:acyltransferase [Antrihabitans sp. YC2-6]|uniref:acyltransferase family protein n=1 Tax=Antrihabitans sp. YC2-6 TaxID=2799498 RepID=UPI0018F3DB0E|nr:acyltransferase [Antrihabitans sp. YC2-6]MBJ8346289.1 acyltransferase [Antrihabitans sp. YC2-6]